jgi:hypothetical protein
VVAANKNTPRTRNPAILAVRPITVAAVTAKMQFQCRS